MPRAIWNGVVVAESPHTEVVEGNHYFPPEAIHAQYYRSSQTHTTCGWKGQASYYDLVVGDAVNHDASPGSGWTSTESKNRGNNLELIPASGSSIFD